MRLRAIAAVIAAAVTIGCDSFREPEGPRPRVVATYDDTPEGQLNRVMDRFRTAIDLAQASSRAGVASKREFSHRLLPPTKEEPRFTADVTIRTQVVLKDENGAADVKVGDKAENGEKSGRDPAESVRDQEIVKLIFDGDRWVLADEPESDTLKLCFESALADE